jgi:hypothetical protein
LIAAPLSDRAETVQRVGLLARPSSVYRLLETLGITSVRRFGFAALSEHRTLPSQHVSEEGIGTIGSELCQRVVVKTQRQGGLFMLFGYPRLLDERACCCYATASH